MRIMLLTLLCVIGMINICRSQCNQYFIYESFTSTLTTQGGTWSVNSMIAVTSPVRTGTHAIGFNGTGDWIRTPLIANPGVLSFWYRRSANTTAWTLNIQTSPNGTTWTTRGSITAINGTYQQYSLNIGALGLTNVYIRLLDSRVSGAHERYIDDFGLTSTSASSNTLIPILSACSETLNSGLTYKITDDGGPAGPISVGYSNNVDRTVTLTPSDNTHKLNLSFTQMDLETSYDYLYVYDGANTSAPLLATLNGTALPSDIMATNSSGQLTLRWTTDISNIGTWGGFFANVTSVVALPVELIEFKADGFPSWNVVKWATASEHNSSHYDLLMSTDGYCWERIVTKSAAVNSTVEIKYSFIDYNKSELCYYRLLQYDIDGKFKEYGPISVFKSTSNKKVIKYVNSIGQEIDPTNYIGTVIELFEDGSFRRTFHY